MMRKGGLNGIWIDDLAYDFARLAIAVDAISLVSIKGLEAIKRREGSLRFDRTS